MIGIFNFSEWPAYLGQVFAGNPWIYTVPCLLVAVQPVIDEETYRLLDSEAQAIEIKISDHSFWKMMAVSGGHPISVFVEWEGGTFRPLSVIMAERVIEL